MFDRNAQLELLLDLETRHDELLSRLEELDKRVAKTLAEYMATRQPTAAGENCASSSGQ
jgi:hypothetical protein